MLALFLPHTPQEASSLTQLIEPNPNHAALPAKTFDPHGQSDHASLSATAASAPKTKLNSSGGAEAREVARRSSTMSFSTATMLRTQQQRQQPPPFRAGDVRRGSAVAYAAGTPMASQSPATDSPSTGMVSVGCSEGSFPPWLSGITLPRDADLCKLRAKRDNDKGQVTMQSATDLAV